ncbi:MAG: methylenetetrahydrofolate reductase, partial [Pseudomonadota bacterium]|jgi:methylenetetrahydrofolate reductase (NADPH)
VKPEFCSVTYGAGGSTQDGTWATVQAIRAEGFEAAPHFSCIGATREAVRAALQKFKATGIDRVVALRGDLPSGHGGFGEFRYASDLVAFMREETGAHFHIEVACYPETHPQAKSPQTDLRAFVAKIDAGASGAITQYFFNSDAYFRFVDEAAAAGVSLDIVPGIMPITNSTQLIRFSEACGAEIPRWIRSRLEAFGDDRASIQAFGLDVVTDLVDQLRSAGVPGIHFYAMNQSTAVLEICRRLALA